MLLPSHPIHYLNSKSNWINKYLTCGFLSAFQYTLLTSAHSIINPRFNLTTPLISGLFYIAPGAGFLLGSIIGGHFSDRTVKKYISKRNGVRLAQDRLNNGLFGLFAVVPGSALIYAWTLQEEKGGLVVPVISAFVAGFGLMGCFNGLNTYAAGSFSFSFCLRGWVNGRLIG